METLLNFWWYLYTGGHTPILKSLTVEITVQYSAGKPRTLEFTWIPITKTIHPNKLADQPMFGRVVWVEEYPH